MSVEWADDPKKTERGPVDGPKKIARAGLKNGRRSSRGRPRHADRPFVEAMMWIARTGSPWRDLPERYPNWRSVYTRWRRWVRQALAAVGAAGAGGGGCGRRWGARSWTATTFSRVWCRVPDPTVPRIALSESPPANTPERMKGCVRVRRTGWGTEPGPPFLSGETLAIARLSCDCATFV
jgi:hypothetical protein